jgi:hypothetical protein
VEIGREDQLSGEPPDEGGETKPTAAGGSEPSAQAAPALDQPSPAKSKSRASLWIGIGVCAVAAVVLLVMGIPLVVKKFTLPDCDDADTRKVVSDMLEDKKIKPAPFSKVRFISATRSERLCAARMEFPGGLIDLQYRIDWDGWNPQVAITEMAAQAKIEPEHLDEVKKATDEFMSLASESLTNGRPPRLTEPTIRRLLDTVFDLARVEGATLASSDLGKALEWSRAGDRIGTVYMLAGTGVTDLANLARSPAAQQRTHRNVADFAPEFARYLDFEVKLAGIMAEAELKRDADAGDADPADSKRKAEEARSVLAETVAGDLTTLAYDGLSDEWRRQRLAVMTQVAPTAAKFLNPEQARALRQHALTVMSYVREKSVQDQITALADAIAPQ